LEKKIHQNIDLLQIQLIIRYTKPTTSLKYLCLNLLNSEKCRDIIDLLYLSKSHLFLKGQVLPFDIETELIPPTTLNRINFYPNDLLEDQITDHSEYDYYYDDTMHYSESDVDVYEDVYEDE